MESNKKPQSLDTELSAYIQLLPGNWSYIVSKYVDGYWQDITLYNPDYQHPSASMIKVLILYSLVQHDRDWSYKLKLSSTPKVEGGGALQEFHEDVELSLETLASLMIVLSDNLATNLLIDYLGFDYINLQAKKLNLSSTKLQRKMMDFVASKQGLENYMSARDYHTLLANIYGNRILPFYDKAWTILSRQQFRDRIPYFWPEEELFHHKTGMLDGVEHDGGIYPHETGDYFIAIFTSEQPSNPVTGQHMSKLGKIIYDYLNK